MIEAIKHNLANLVNFDGRDQRSTFWWYVLFLLVVYFVAGFLIAIPMTVSAMSSTFEAVQNGVDPENMQSGLIDSLTGAMETQIWLNSILGLAMVALLAASFVRRLHDSGKPGWIALIPAALYLGSLVFNIVNFDNMMETMRAAMDTSNPARAMQMQSELYAYSLLTWLAYLVVIIFGVLDSNRGPNKYGEEPDY